MQCGYFCPGIPTDLPGRFRLGSCANRGAQYLVRKLLSTPFQRCIARGDPTAEAAGATWLSSWPLVPSILWSFFTPLIRAAISFFRSNYTMSGIHTRPVNAQSSCLCRAELNVCKFRTTSERLRISTWEMAVSPRGFFALGRYNIQAVRCQVTNIS